MDLLEICLYYAISHLAWGRSNAYLVRKLKPEPLIFFDPKLT